MPGVRVTCSITHEIKDQTSSVPRMLPHEAITFDTPTIEDAMARLDLYMGNIPIKDEAKTIHLMGTIETRINDSLYDSINSVILHVHMKKEPKHAERRKIS